MVDMTDEQDNPTKIPKVSPSHSPVQVCESILWITQDQSIKQIDPLIPSSKDEEDENEFQFDESNDQKVKEGWNYANPSSFENQTQV